MKRVWIAAAAVVIVLSMARGTSAAPIFDQTKVVTNLGRVELIVDDLPANLYQATLIWSPTGYSGGAADYISNVAVKLTSNTSNESLLVDPFGTWALEVNAASNFGAADGCGGHDHGSLCAKTTDLTNTTDASRTWTFQFDTNSLFTQDQFHVQVQFHNSGGSPAGQISARFDSGTSGDTPVPVPEPASLSLLGLGLPLAGMGARRWRQRKP
jgi:hypothetical protein